MSPPLLFRLVTIGIVLGAGSMTTTAGLGFEEPGEKIATGLLESLRTSCAKDPKLRGILVRKATVGTAGRQIVLTGTVDQELQRALLKSEAERLLAEAPAWRDRFPDGVQTSRLTVFPIRSTYLLNLRRDFAASDPVNAPARGLASQTRLDDVYFAENQNLVFEGRCIDRDAHAEWQRAREQPGGGRAHPAAPLAKTLLRLLRGHADPAEFDALKLTIDVSPILFDRPNPIYALQKRVSRDAGIEGVLFQEAWYDDQLVLQFGGLLGAPAQQAAVENLVRLELDPSYLAPANARGKVPPPGWSLKAMTPSEWHPSLLAALQAQFAQDTLLPFRQTRLDHADFRYSEDGRTLSLRFSGVYLGAQAPQPANLLPRRLDRECQKLIKTPRPSQPQIDASGIITVGTPARQLQERVWERPELDGVRIDQVYFDKDGRFGTSGLWTGEAQATDLELLLNTFLKRADVELLRGGPTWRYMTAIPVSAWLRELREGGTVGLTEVFLERLAFDQAGSLTVQGFCKEEPGDVVKKVEEQLAGMLDTRLGDQRTTPSHSHLKQLPKSLLTKLRTMVAAEPALDGIRIDNGFFDPDGRFLIDGFQEEPNQARRLEALFQKLAAHPDWKEQLSRGWKVGTFLVSPVRPLLNFLIIMAPNDPEFDGVALQRVYYAPLSRPPGPQPAPNRRAVAQGGVAPLSLVFAGVATRHVDPDKLGGRVRRLLKITSKLEIEINLKQIPPDRELADLNVRAAIQQITAGQLDASLALLDKAIFHNPRDSTAWYLRAACALGRGDLASASRDGHRTLGIEERDGGSRSSRMRQLERMQNDLRIRTDGLLEQLAREK